MKKYNDLKRKLATVAGMAFGVMALSVVPANASVIFVFEGTSAGSSAGTTNFTYDINFQTNTDQGTGLPSDRFVGDTTTYGTLYDITGFLSAVLTPGAPFSVSTQLLGKTPVGIAPTDSPTATNITVTYTGPTTTVDTSFPLVLVVNSSVSGVSLQGQYSGQDIKNAGGAAGTVATNFGFVSVPTAATSTPEPGALYSVVGGIGLLLCGRIRRRSSK